MQTDSTISTTDLEGLRCEALRGVNDAQLAFQAMLNDFETGLEPNEERYESIAQRMRFAAGALEAMKSEVLNLEAKVVRAYAEADSATGIAQSLISRSAPKSARSKRAS